MALISSKKCILVSQNSALKPFSIVKQCLPSFGLRLELISSEFGVRNGCRIECITVRPLTNVDYWIEDSEFVFNITYGEASENFDMKRNSGNVI